MRAITYAFLSSLLVIALGAVSVGAHDATPPASQMSQMNPQAKASFVQGEANLKKKDWNRAIAAYQQAVRLEPKFAEAWNNMGYSYRKLKQYDKALDAYRKVLDIRPDFTYPHEYMARTYLAMGNRGAAMREYEILKRLDAKMGAELFEAIKANDPDHEE